MKSITVSMTVYGYSQYLEEQLNSIFNQTYKINELVVVEDYSNMTSPRDLVSSLCQKNNVKLIYKLLDVNLGPPEAFRIACKHSTGDVVFFCDHDDIWNHDRVLLSIKKHTNHEMVVCNGYVFTNPSELLNTSCLPKLYNFWSSRKWYEILLRNNLVGATISVDGNLIRYISKNYKFSPMHDWNLNIYFALKKKPISFIDKPLIMYRRHDSTFTGRFNNSFLKRLKYRLQLLRFVWHAFNK